jgi:hypothetical protein
MTLLLSRWDQEKLITLTDWLTVKGTNVAAEFQEKLKLITLTIWLTVKGTNVAGKSQEKLITFIK